MSDLEHYFKEKFYEKNLIDKLNALALDDYKVVSELIKSLQPNANVFRQIFSLLEEVCKAQNRSYSDILNSIELKDSSRKEKQIQLRNILEQMRFPVRFKIQQKLDSHVKQIFENYGISIILPSELEGDTLELKFKVRGSSDLLKKSEKIQALVQSELCDRIFDILEGKEL